MEDRQSSYFPTSSTPRPDQHSSMRQPSAIDTSSRMGQRSRLEHQESDRLSRTGQPSAIQRQRKEQKIFETEIENDLIDTKKIHKSTSLKNTSTKTDEKKTQVDFQLTKDLKKEVDVQEIKKKQLTYPIPKPPPTRKADIFKMETAVEIDKRVLNVDVESAPDMKALTLSLTARYYKDVDKVRAIFAWICLQKLDQLDYSRSINDKSPLHHLKEVKDKKSSYPELFAIMCKNVDIPCHAVSGVAKLENHEIGETEIDKNRVKWNTVYCADGWRIVFFQWAFDTVSTKKTEQQPVPLENTPLSSKTGSFKEPYQNGESSTPKLPAISNSSVTSRSSKTFAHTGNYNHGVLKKFEKESILNVNEYYFLTDPEEFIFRCFPDEDMWQLLGKPHSIEKFLKLPVVSQAFFDHHLKISSRLNGIRKAKHGSCIISIKRMDSRHIFLDHKFELIASESPDVDVELDFKFLVAVVHDERKTHFHMRFPVEGMYDFKVFGGASESDSEFLCSFKVNCEEPKLRFEALPLVPEIGFGPCRVTERFGMKLVSKVTGLITIRGPDTIEIDFKVLKDIKVIAEMIHHTTPSSDLEEYISLKQHNDDLFITVGVPRNGEYVLKLHAKHRRSNKDFINVCNFLLMSEDPKKPRKPFESAGDLMIRQQLMNTLKTSKNPEDVQMAIDKLNKEDLPDDGWLTKAYERLEYLKLAKALRNGINRKNADVLEKAIQDAKQSSLSDKLNNYIREGEQMLQEADNNSMFILEMKRTTISEVHRYKKPKPVMYDVMKATYILLGEKPESLTTWDAIVYLMRMTSRNSLLYKVKQFDKNYIDPSTAQEVDRLLKTHTLEEAKASSAGVGTFFMWASDIIKPLTKVKKSTQPKKEQTTNGYKEEDTIHTTEK
ncbi:lim and transglutaminase domain protein ltd-1-like [Mytilus edulis]|uniref:lim and transglutaminase domain protein ltd-1-like n=1 Tax=Mytilus edulis TaxID=6550 RepID=UPI0039EF5404